MKITLANLDAAKTVIAKIANSDLPISMSFKLTRFLKTAAQELSLFEESRTKLIVKYGKESEERLGVFTVLDEYMAAYQSDLLELSNTEIELEFPITMTDLESLGDAVKITPREAIMLQELFA